MRGLHWMLFGLLVVISVFGCDKGGKVDANHAKRIIVKYVLSEPPEMNHGNRIEVKEVPIINLWEKVHAQLFLCSWNNGVCITDRVYYFIYNQKAFRMASHPLYSLVANDDGIFYTVPVTESGAVELGFLYFSDDALKKGGSFTIHGYELLVKEYDWGIGVESGRADGRINCWEDGKLVGRIKLVGYSVVFDKCDSLSIYLDPSQSRKGNEHWWPRYLLAK